MIRTLRLAAVAALLATPLAAQDNAAGAAAEGGGLDAARNVLADLESRSSPDDVATTMDRLVAAAEAAGATVFARVDHAEGAREAGLELGEAQLLVFGNPQLGTPVMREDIRAGLFLPLRVLVHATENGSRIVWQSPEEMLDELGFDDDMEALVKMNGALENLTAKAAGQG